MVQFWRWENRDGFIFEKSTTSVSRAVCSPDASLKFSRFSECIHMMITSITVTAGVMPEGRSGTFIKVA